MNPYASLDDVKAKLNVTGTTDDTLLLSVIGAASRNVESICGRRFHTGNETHYISGTKRDILEIPDMLSITSLKTDTTEDHTWASSWTETTDYFSEFDQLPVTMLRITSWSGLSWDGGVRHVMLTGVFGAGNLRDTSPWNATALTGTVATTGGTALTLSAVTGLVVGQTIKVDSEQMEVKAIGTLSATVTRGINGTTAATHTTGAVTTPDYPDEVKAATLILACEVYRTMQTAGYLSERIGEYSYTVSNNGDMPARLRMLLSRCVRFAL